MLRQFGGTRHRRLPCDGGRRHSCAPAGPFRARRGHGWRPVWAWVWSRLLRPTALRLVFVGWLIVAFPIGWVVGRLALAAMFFGLFTAVGLLFRMMGRDPMTRRRQSGSYWAPRDRSTTPSDYLRQY